MSCQRRLHGGHGVFDVLIVPVTEQVLHHRIVAVDELNDQFRPESSQPLNQFDQRNIATDDCVFRTILNTDSRGT